MFQLKSLGKSHEHIFSMVYKEKIWGLSEADDLPFNSGNGSIESLVVEPYINAVESFLSKLPNRASAVDLGCGDFRVGSRLVDFFDSYIACDVVKEVIEFNIEHYRDLGVDFRVLDLTRGPIPVSDVLIVRQVLQHLSNEAIHRFINLIPQEVKYLLITEHLPSEKPFRANRNGATGPDIRLSRKSGVVLTKEPFNLTAQSQEVLVSVPSSFGSIVTTAYKL